MNNRQHKKYYKTLQTLWDKKYSKLLRNSNGLQILAEAIACPIKRDWHYREMFNELINVTEEEN